MPTAVDVEAPPSAEWRVVVGVSGGIASYKALLLVRALQARGAKVRVVMTSSAKRFVQALSFAALTQHPVLEELWDASRGDEAHVELGQWAQDFIVAPATMNALARWAQGFADDALLASLACTQARCFAAPAMHREMWMQASTQRNVAWLEAQGVRFIGPEEGALASGDFGIGRMSEPEAIADRLVAERAGGQSLAGRRILVSAGPTQEALDPVRFLGNRSSGKMGYALARLAAERGAKVTLVSGPVRLATPPGVERIDVSSALEMREVLQRSWRSLDALLMSAAVADFRPERYAEQKLKKGAMGATLSLVPNPDLIAEIGHARPAESPPLLVAFAAETENLLQHAERKLQDKKVDLVVANDARVALESDRNEITLVSAGEVRPFPACSKREAAAHILDWVAQRLSSRVSSD